MSVDYREPFAICHATATDPCFVQRVPSSPAGKHFPDGESGPAARFDRRDDFVRV